MKKVNFSRHVPVKALVPGSRLAVRIPGTGMAWVEASEYAAAIVRIVHKTLDQKTLQTPAAPADNGFGSLTAKEASEAEAVAREWDKLEAVINRKPLAAPDAPQQPQEARTGAGVAELAECTPAGSGIAWGGKALRECLSVVVTNGSNPHDRDTVAICEMRNGFVAYGQSVVPPQFIPLFWIRWTSGGGYWQTIGHPGPQRKINSDGSTEEIES